MDELANVSIQHTTSVVDDSSISTASTDEKHDNDSEHADHSESEDCEFCNEEVEAVSSLANIFHVANSTASHYSDCLLRPHTYERSERRKGRRHGDSSPPTGAVDYVSMKKQRRCDSAFPNGLMICFCHGSNGASLMMCGAGGKRTGRRRSSLGSARSAT